MANGIVSNEEEYKGVFDPTIERFGQRVGSALKRFGESWKGEVPSTLEGYDIAGRSEALGKVSNDMSKKVLESVMARTMQEAIPADLSPSHVATKPSVTAPTTKAPVVSAVAPVTTTSAVPKTNDYIERMSRQFEESGSIPLQTSGGITFQARDQGGPELRELELERAIGITPKSGMAEYEENVRGMREEARLERLVRNVPAKYRAGIIQEGIKSQADIERSRVGAISEREKTKAASGLKIYESALKSQADWAKIGIAAGDLKSKQEYRRAQIDDLMTRTGLLEPTKLKLARAKDAREAIKIRREAATSALDKDFNPRLKLLQDSMLPGVPPTEEQKAEFEKLMQDRQNAESVIDEMFPVEGTVKSFPDGRVGRFDGTRWVDVTDQLGNKGVVGR